MRAFQAYWINAFARYVRTTWHCRGKTLLGIRRHSWSVKGRQKAPESILLQVFEALNQATDGMPGGRSSCFFSWERVLSGDGAGACPGCCGIPGSRSRGASTRQGRPRSRRAAKFHAARAPPEFLCKAPSRSPGRPTFTNLFWGEGFPLLKLTTGKGYPYSNLSTGGPGTTCCCSVG